MAGSHLYIWFVFYASLPNEIKLLLFNIFFFGLTFCLRKMFAFKCVIPLKIRKVDTFWTVCKITIIPFNLQSTYINFKRVAVVMLLFQSLWQIYFCSCVYIKNISMLLCWKQHTTKRWEPTAKSFETLILLGYVVTFLLENIFQQSKIFYFHSLKMLR